MTKRLALALGLRDRNDLAEQSIGPLLNDDIDLFLIDGSQTEKGRVWAEDAALHHGAHLHAQVTGGADRWIVHALATMLQFTDAPYVGLVENDVLLHTDWLGPTLALFERGATEGLLVGAVSARCYDDRILCQRDGYALMHNTGAGHIIFTRKAARLVLDTYRSHWTTGNVKIFHQLCGLDIRKWWAFRGAQHFITVDWGLNAILAAHGLASLALTPSCVEMIGQTPPLHQQGLVLATEPVELLRDDAAFDLFAGRTLMIRRGNMRLPDQMFCRLDDGSQVVFAHQVGALDANQHGDWRQRWSQGFGPFAYVADPQPEEPPPTVEVPIVGPCTFFVSGGKTGGFVNLTDTQSGYDVGRLELPPEGETGQTMQLVVPGNVAYRTIRLTALTPGVTFFGIKTNEPQIVNPVWAFGLDTLPPPV